MGAASSLTENNIKFEQLTVIQVADFCCSIGPAYEKYKDTIINEKIDGAFIATLSGDELKTILNEIGIKSTVHRAKIYAELMKLQSILTGGNDLKTDSEVPKKEAELRESEVPKKESEPRELSKFEMPVNYFVFGGAEDYQDGLTKKIIGCFRSIEEECSINDHGIWKEHYDYVVHQAAFEHIPDPSQPHRVRDQGHTGMTLAKFCKLDNAVKAKLTTAEVAMLRLYTGPMYKALNEALRYYDKDPSLVEQWSTCLSVLSEAIVKLSFSTPPGKVFRGVNESLLTLPDTFVAAEEGQFAGGVELGFMSTTYDEKVAIEYSQRGPTSACTVFEIDFDLASRGAPVKWLSQFPYEEELLFPPCTALTCKGPSKQQQQQPPPRDSSSNIRGLIIGATVCHKIPDTSKIKEVTDVDELAVTRWREKKRQEEVAQSDPRVIELRKLRKMKVPLANALAKGFTVVEIAQEKGWFTLREFVAQQCAWRDLYKGGFPLLDLYKAGYKDIPAEAFINAVKLQDCSIVELKAAGVSGRHLKGGGLAEEDLEAAGYKPHDIYSAQDMVDLFAADAKLLYSRGYKEEEIAAVGFDVKLVWRRTCTFIGHTDQVNCIATTVGGGGEDDTTTTIVSCSSDESLKIWSTVAGNCTRTVHLAKKVFIVAVLRDGRVVTSTRQIINVWDSEVHTCLHVFESHPNMVGSDPNTVWALVELADGRLAAGYTDKTIKIWDLVSGSPACVRTLSGHLDPVRCLALTADGSIVSGSDDRHIKIWNPSTGTCSATLSGHANNVFCMQVLTDGSLVSGSSDNTVKIWDLTTFQCMRTLSGHSNSVNAVIEIVDGVIASGSGDKTIKFWDTATGVCKHTLKATENSRIYGLLKLPDGRFAANCSNKKIYCFST